MPETMPQGRLPGSRQMSGLSAERRAKPASGYRIKMTASERPTTIPPSVYMTSWYQRGSGKGA